MEVFNTDLIKCKLTEKSLELVYKNTDPGRRISRFIGEMFSRYMTGKSVKELLKEHNPDRDYILLWCSKSKDEELREIFKKYLKENL